MTTTEPSDQPPPIQSPATKSQTLCPDCRGWGNLQIVTHVDPLGLSAFMPSPRSGSWGRLSAVDCIACQGSGYLERRTTTTMVPGRGGLPPHLKPEPR